MPARLDTELTKKYAAKPADKIAGDIPSWWVSFTKLKAVLSYLKYSAPVRFEMLFDLSAIDESERLKTGYTLFYHLLSVSHNQDIRILVNVENENIKIPTITDIWSSANWYEREIYDMFGLIFKGHPNLRRLLLPDYWKGHPLRKSYPFRATDMPPPFDLDTDDYARIMESYEIPDNRKP
ncbi:MAG: NADH-quinone oxidoreductase subunit C, partial [Endozoicomonadaceae bacterium]|nr:NADH-quinone oxidoreductase subunit C [Endozoicomonadaceae bacterium]